MEQPLSPDIDHEPVSAHEAGSQNAGAGGRERQEQRPPTTHVRPPGYDFAAFEAKWRTRWEESGLYRVDLWHAARPYYNLMMFPYPSAEGLHIGNVYSYVGSDVHGRFQAMQGYDVFEPIGFDAFGIHSENFAIKHGIHPRITTANNIRNFRRQLESIGNRFDWSHEVNTTSPAYYRWTQWIFLQLFKGGLAERKKAAVNWCPQDKTVLADEQVINGRCERCDTPVERRWLEQWFLKITRYAQRLLDNLDHLDWSERVKAAQRNWIGRSEGLEFAVSILGMPEQTLWVYTPTPEAIEGMTFIALAPQHPLIDCITSAAQREAVEQYQAARQIATGAGQTMTGAFTGAYALHPKTSERLPIWVADYVGEYGVDALMGAPASSELDLAFAQAMGLPVRAIEPLEPVEAARAAAMGWFETRGLGRRAVKYRLRDWLISRQRYWGPPIPIVYCPEHGAVPVPAEQLPVLLPEMEDWLPTGSGVSPLATMESFVHTSCPLCGQPARRETDVSDNFLDSAWYYLRYPSDKEETQPWNPELTKKWLPVNMYIGGGEHSVLHLMYARFICLALHDLGYLEFEEPFMRFRANGTITLNGQKISKSRGNVVNPDEYIERFGSDVVRVYLLFMGPYEAGGDFTDQRIGGVVRFLDRVWHLVTRQRLPAAEEAPQGEARRMVHLTIRRVTEDITAFKYHTAIAALMEYVNSLVSRKPVTREELQTLLLLLAPFAPYLTEELWEQLGNRYSIHAHPWPAFDPAATRAAIMTIMVEVNGHVRARIQVPTDTPEDEIKRQALATEKIQRLIAGHTVQRVLYVPGRLVNVVPG